MGPRRSRCISLIVIACVGMAACTASLFRNYGRINPSEAVTRAFEEHQVNPAFRYYISGPDLNPNAIMGLDRNSHLDPSTLWREVDMSTARMKEIVEGMQAKVFGLQTVLHGFELSDNNGRPIGVWYSILKARTSLRMNDDGTVRIDTPDLDTYESREGDSLRSVPRVPHRY